MINKVGIVITCMNEVEYTKRAIDSIMSDHDCHLIVIDDFSMDGTKDFLKELAANNPNVTIITDPDTDSLGAKWNLGAEKARELGCDAVLICNNDILFHPQTIDNLVKRLNQAQANNELVVMVSACNRRGDCKPEEIFTLPLPPESSEAEHPDFSCFLLDFKAWEYVGRFSTAYKPCYFEDNDFHTTLKLHNLKAIAITDAPYYHFGSVTQNQVPGGLCKSPQFEYNRNVYVAKFGSTPDQIDIEKVRTRFGIVPVTSLKAIG